MDDLRKSAECHKMVRKNIRQFIKPGARILDICNRIEDDIIKIFGKNDLSAGIAFPTGIGINNIIAHDTANVDDKRILKINDLCKIDIGTHYNGYITDSAFSVCFNPEYDKLLEASKEAMWAAIKMVSVDVPINDISKVIKEVIESYEVTIQGKTYNVKPITDIGGHSIGRYNIHAGQLILCGPHESYNERILDNTQYAIECFASSGSGKMIKSVKPSNHYMLKSGMICNSNSNSNLKIVKNVDNWIRKNRSTLAFCPRWLSKELKCVPIALNELSRKSQIVNEYPILEDSDPHALVSQFEHTIFVNDGKVEVLSHGDDY